MIRNMNQYNDCIYGHLSDQLMLYSHVLRPKTLYAVVRKVALFLSMGVFPVQ